MYLTHCSLRTEWTLTFSRVFVACFVVVACFSAGWRALVALLPIFAPSSHQTFASSPPLIPPPQNASDSNSYVVVAKTLRNHRSARFAAMPLAPSQSHPQIQPFGAQFLSNFSLKVSRFHSPTHKPDADALINAFQAIIVRVVEFGAFDEAGSRILREPIGGTCVLAE